MPILVGGGWGGKYGRVRWRDSFGVGLGASGAGGRSYFPLGEGMVPGPFWIRGPRVDRQGERSLGRPVLLGAILGVSHPFPTPPYDRCQQGTKGKMPRPPQKSNIADNSPDNSPNTARGSPRSRPAHPGGNMDRRPLDQAARYLQSSRPPARAGGEPGPPPAAPPRYPGRECVRARDVRRSVSGVYDRLPFLGSMALGISVRF